MSDQHNLSKQNSSLFGSWLECKDCGATFHSKMWWLGGYKSKDEPPCAPNNTNHWVSKAEKVTGDNMNGIYKTVKNIAKDMHDVDGISDEQLEEYNDL